MSIKDRIYEDYFKKSRLPEYRRTLQKAKEHGYQMVGVLDFARLVRANDLENKKIYVNRHDIDTSPKVAAEMFAIEKEIYGDEGTATYYFRDTTTDIKLIHEIEAYGYETGYHYEELATYAKRHKLKSRNAIEEHIPEASKQFLADLKRFRETTGSSSITVASHGDFINTRYGIQNFEMLKIQTIRENACIEMEAYDADVMQFIIERYADQNLLKEYANRLIDAFEREISIVMSLTHPRNWKVDMWSSTIENWNRLIQDIMYRL